MILVEKGGVDEFAVQLLTLVKLAAHELSAESIVAVQTLNEVLLVEGLEQLRVVRVDVPVTLQTFKEGLGHVLEVAPNIEVVQSHLVLALQVEVLEYKVLG